MPNDNKRQIDPLSEGIDKAFSILGEAISNVGSIPLSAGPQKISTRTGGYSTGDVTRERQMRLERERKERIEAARARREEIDRQRAAIRGRRAGRQVSADNSQMLPVLVKPQGAGAVVSTVFGGVGIGVSGIALLSTIPAIVAGSASVGGLIVGVAFVGMFGALLRSGVARNKNARLAARYASLCGTRQYIEIDSIASSTGTSPRKVVRNIKKLLREGYFPQGHLDDECKNLILSDEVYRQYTMTKKNVRISTDKDIIDTTAREVVQDEYDKMDIPDDVRKELRRIVTEGNDYISKLHQLNADIPGEDISAKLDRLEGLLKEIFSRVKEHPDQISRMDELMEYYLPTVLKIVDAYEEYDKVSEPGPEIISAKEEIESTLGTINDALSKLLNLLFKDSVLDVTTDAQVLETVLAQKGLS